jgi:hypothetical protein
MDDQEILAILDELRSGEVREYRVQKGEFLKFRQHLIAQDDFKHFRGIAQQGGDIIYTYLETPRS